jgi:hypothetical protein
VQAEEEGEGEEGGGPTPTPAVSSSFHHGQEISQSTTSTCNEIQSGAGGGALGLLTLGQS